MPTPADRLLIERTMARLKAARAKSAPAYNRRKLNLSAALDALPRG
jgi:hypothetical protein